MKYIENKRFMEFLTQGHNDFGWNPKYLLDQIVSVCTVVGGGPECPRITEEARRLLLDMFRNSSESYSNLWSSLSILQVIQESRKAGKDPTDTFKLLFESCRGVDGKRWGSGASVP